MGKVLHLHRPCVGTTVGVVCLKRESSFPWAPPRLACACIFSEVSGHSFQGNVVHWRHGHVKHLKISNNHPDAQDK